MEDRGANPLKKNYDGQTLVSQLADLPQAYSVDSHVEMIRILFKAGIAIDDMDRLQRSALHHAVRIGNLIIAKELLSSGADPKLSDLMFFRTTLHHVASKDKDFSELLLEYKAEVHCDEDGWTQMAGPHSTLRPIMVVWA